MVAASFRIKYESQSEVYSRLTDELSLNVRGVKITSKTEFALQLPIDNQYCPTVLSIEARNQPLD